MERVVLREAFAADGIAAKQPDEVDNEGVGNRPHRSMKIGNCYLFSSTVCVRNKNSPKNKPQAVQFLEYYPVLMGSGARTAASEKCLPLSGSPSAQD